MPTKPSYQVKTRRKKRRHCPMKRDGVRFVNGQHSNGFKPNHTKNGEKSATGGRLGSKGSLGTISGGEKRLEGFVGPV